MAEEWGVAWEADLPVAREVQRASGTADVLGEPAEQWPGAATSFASDGGDVASSSVGRSGGGAGDFCRQRQQAEDVPLSGRSPPADTGFVSWLNDDDSC